MWVDEGYKGLMMLSRLKQFTTDDQVRVPSRGESEDVTKATLAVVFYD